MIISRRAAMAGIAGAVGAGSAATTMMAEPEAVIATGGSTRLLASALGIRGDDTTGDTDHAQRMIAAAARQFRTIHFEGRHEWVFRTSLTLFGSEDTGSSMLRGEGAYATVIRCSDSSKAVFVNDESERDFRRLSIRGLTIRGGKSGLSLRRHGEQVASLLDMNDVRFEYQTDIGLECEQYLISSNFTDVVFYYCNRGIYCGRNANNLLFTKARFEGLNGRSVEFASPGGSINGCEDVRFISPRFEARNEKPAADASVIGGYRLSTMTVDGGYFENTHSTILHERGSLGQIAFRNCHFTGQAPVAGKLQRETFDSDGIVTLDGNRFLTGSDGAPHMLIAGVNRGLSHERFGFFTEYSASIRYVGPMVKIRGGTMTLLRIYAATPSASQESRPISMSASIKIAIATDDGSAERPLRCDLVIDGRTDGQLRARISPLQPADLGYSISGLPSDDGGIAIILTDSTGLMTQRRAVADLSGLTTAQGEQPFMIA